MAAKKKTKSKRKTGMTKDELIRHLAHHADVKKKTAASFLNTLTSTAIKETKKSGSFVIPGLGRLVKATSKARLGRNPQTGDPIKTSARTFVKFRASKSLKEVFGTKKKGGTYPGPSMR